MQRRNNCQDLMYYVHICYAQFLNDLRHDSFLNDTYIYTLRYSI